METEFSPAYHRESTDADGVASLERAQRPKCLFLRALSDFSMENFEIYLPEKNCYSKRNYLSTLFIHLSADGTCAHGSSTLSVGESPIDCRPLFLGVR